MNYETIYVIIGSLTVIGIFVLILNKYSKTIKTSKQTITKYRERYDGLINVDEEIDKRKKEFQDEQTEMQLQIENSKSSLMKLKEKYQIAEEAYKKLMHENSVIQDNLDIAEFGIYEPHFDFETSETFKEEIRKLREEQKAMIKADNAILGGEGWTVNDSVQKGKTMIRRQKKLMLRAFNGECDSFISNVAWNNVKRYEERINKSSEAINKMAETQRLTISSPYSFLKMKELWLTHEFRLKKQEEKEEQRRIKELMREEEKARRDFEKAQKEAQKEEKMLKQAMEKAQQEVAKAGEEERAKFEAQLAELENQLKEAEEKNQRAISMAQQTKKGHVYIISNIGSFGENVFKIGMTRRLEPMDRINELGDASVPFKFDVHAMIHSDNAPELENQLHKAFNDKRLNFVNLRREYFDVSLEEIKKIVEDNHGKIEFIKEPEAKEYRESLLIKEQMKEKEKAIETEIVPVDDLFAVE